MGGLIATPVLTGVAEQFAQQRRSPARRARLGSRGRSASRRTGLTLSVGSRTQPIDRSSRGSAANGPVAFDDASESSSPSCLALLVPPPASCCHRGRHELSSTLRKKRTWWFFGDISLQLCHLGTRHQREGRKHTARPHLAAASSANLPSLATTKPLQPPASRSPARCPPARPTAARIVPAPPSLRARESQPAV